MSIHLGKKFLIKLSSLDHNVYGPDMGQEHVVPELISKISTINKKKKFYIEGSGKEIRSFIHIEDLLGLLKLFLRKGST